MKYVKHNPSFQKCQFSPVEPLEFRKPAVELALRFSAIRRHVVLTFVLVALGGGWCRGKLLDVEILQLPVVCG